MKFKRAINNVIIGFGSQLLIIALGLIIPRLMMKSYGSEVNGLFNMVNNIYMYLALVEGGIGTSALQSLYKPVASNNRDEINSILAATRRYYKRLTIVYVLGVMTMAIILPYIVDTSINKWEFIGIILLQGLASIFNFYLLAGVTVLFSAEGKEYVQKNIMLITTVLINVMKIILVNFEVNIIFLQLCYFCISMLSVGIYRIYIRKYYSWIDVKYDTNGIVLKQRNSFLIHQMVYVIFNNTDVIVISIFLGLKVSSVYSIYNMVFLYVLNLINALFDGVKFTLGHSYNENKQKYILIHDAYNSYYCAFVFAMFSVCYVLITPFIHLYTAGINDIQYVDSYLPLLFCIANLLSCCRSTEINLINLAFHAKQTLPRSIFEAILNLSISLILVQQIGIYGCLIGTIVALLYRSNDIIIYANKKILNRIPKQSYITVVSNFTLFFIVVVIANKYNLEILNYKQFFTWGMALTPSLLFVYFLLNSLINKIGYKYVTGVFKSKLSTRLGL